MHAGLASRKLPLRYIVTDRLVPIGLTLRAQVDPRITGEWIG